MRETGTYFRKIFFGINVMIFQHQLTKGIYCIAYQIVGSSGFVDQFNLVNYFISNHSEYQTSNFFSPVQFLTFQNQAWTNTS